MEFQIWKIKPACFKENFDRKNSKLEYLSTVQRLGIKNRNVELIKAVLEELVNG